MAGLGLTQAILNAERIKSMRQDRALRGLQMQNEQMRSEQTRDEARRNKLVREGLTKAYYDSEKTEPFEYSGADFAPIPGAEGLKRITGIDRSKYLQGAEKTYLEAGQVDKAEAIRQLRKDDEREGYKKAWQYARVGMWDEANKAFNAGGDYRGKIEPHPGFKDESVMLYTPENGKPIAINLEQFGVDMGYLKEKDDRYLKGDSFYDTETGEWITAPPGTGGGKQPADDYMARAIQADNPGMSYTDALNLYKSGRFSPQELAMKYANMIMEQQNSTAMLPNDKGYMTADQAYQHGLELLGSQGRGGLTYQGTETGGQGGGLASPAGGAPAEQVQLPPQVASRLKEGVRTTFANGQVWTLENGQPVRVQ